MRNAVSPRVTIGVPAGIVVALAGLGAYLESSLGGPGTTAFVVRLLLVSLAVVGAVLLGLAARLTSGPVDVLELDAAGRQSRDR